MFSRIRLGEGQPDVRGTISSAETGDVTPETNEKKWTGQDGTEDEKM